MPAVAQSFLIKGKVTDAETGDPVPFAGVKLKGKKASAITNFDGYFQITTTDISDSLVCSYVGYKSRTKALRKVENQTVNFQLKSEGLTTKDVVIMAGENPAWEIMRRTIDNKRKNNMAKLTAYEYDSYTKIEVDVDNLSEKFKKRKVVKQIQAVMDSIQVMAGDEGQPVLPVFISESISKFYYRKNPQAQREEIKNTRTVGIGLEDGSTINQFIGSSFQQYNFYNNWLNIVSKDFASPIADGWRFIYDYELEDSVSINEEYCYKLSVKPKRAGDYAFTGTIWISKEDYALKQIDVATTKTTGINFVDKIKIQQTLVRVNGDAWLPNKSRITINISNLSKSFPGMIAKFFSSNQSFRVDEPKPVKFYEIPLEVAGNANTVDPEFWNKNRHDSLSTIEKNVFRMIDTVKQLPIVKTYVEIADIFVNGYYDLGKISLGPYLYSYAWNNIEGHRFRAGFKTNYSFSKNLVAKAWGAYGTTDKVFKYSADVKYIFNKTRWTTFGVSSTYDLEQVALVDNLSNSNALFIAFNRVGNLNTSRPFYQTTNNAYFSTLLSKGLEAKVVLETRDFNPTYSDFGYYQYPRETGSAVIPPISKTFNATEVQLSLRYSRFEYFIQNDNERIPVNTLKWPVFNFRYIRGFNGLLLGDLTYSKYQFSTTHAFNTGILGNGRFGMEAGYIPDAVPYPLLKSHLGNQGFFYNNSSYNLMNLFEFVSDRWASVRYTQYFEGLLFNRLPLLKKWNWRLTATGKMLYGDVSEKNKNLNFVNGNQAFNPLGTDPYVEVGYGVENIFRLLRIEFVHRVTYNTPGSRSFGIFGTVQFQL